MAEIDRSLLSDDNILYLDNGKIRIGVNLGLGGAVTYLAEIGKKNLINSYDWGRQIQMSFYSGPIPYEPEGYKVREEWKALGWNPIQSGDCYNHPSKILEQRISDNEIYVKSIPMQWPMENCPGECTFETWYRLDGKNVQVHSRLVNKREDKTQYDSRHQELPAVYTNGEWYKLVSYIGTKPCTNDAVTELCTKENGLGWPWIGFRATEGWAALVDDNNYGLGPYNSMSCEWIGGFAGDMGSGEEKDFPTGYISPLTTEIIDHNIVFDYEYTLIVGDLDSIRDYAVSNIKKDKATTFKFESDRQHFSYRGTRDSGLPLNGCLEFDHPAGSVVLGVNQFYDGSEIKNIVLDAEFDKDASICFNFNCYDGVYRDRNYQYPMHTVSMEAKAGGRQTYTVPVNTDEKFVGFHLWFGSEGHAKIYSISFEK